MECWILCSNYHCFLLYLSASEAWVSIDASRLIWSVSWVVESRITATIAALRKEIDRFCVGALVAALILIQPNVLTHIHVGRVFQTSDLAINWLMKYARLALCHIFAYIFLNDPLLSVFLLVLTGRNISVHLTSHLVESVAWIGTF